MVDKETQFFQAIGEAVTIWANIEYELCLIFRCCMGDKFGAGSDAFYAMLQFNTKLKSTHAAAKVAFIVARRTDLLDKWTNIYNRLDRQSRNRNKLAHYRSIPKHYYYDIDPKSNELGLVRPHIPMVEVEEALKLDEFISLENIEGYLESFKVLHSDMQEFTSETYRAIAEKPKSLLKVRLLKPQK